MSIKNIVKENLKDNNLANHRINKAYEEAKKINEKTNAYITIINPQEQIDKLDKVSDKEKQSMKLYKIPYVVKDNISTKGVRTTGGTKILSNYIPVFDAEIITRLKKEGAVLIGKTNLDELGMGGTGLNSSYGKTVNPLDTSRISGGSSSGSAAAILSDNINFAIGTDTGDSVRKPASYVGAIGIKPTYGRISRYGVFAYSSTLDHVGYFTKNVEDASLILEILAGRDDKDFTSSFNNVENYSDNLNNNLKGIKLAIIPEIVNTMKNEKSEDLEGKIIFENLVQKLKQQGIEIIEKSIDIDLLKSILPVYNIISNCEASANTANLDGVNFGVREKGETAQEQVINSRTEGLGILVRKKLAIGSYGLNEENQDRIFIRAKKIRRLIKNEIDKILKEVDGIILPATPTIAPLIEKMNNANNKYSQEYKIAENHLAIGNLVGYPGLTLKMGEYENMPIGVNIMTNAFEEQKLLNIALGIEKVLNE